ncbi:50S ribosomal protein L10 [bacterium]|jgi:large subunit ribosomal protein L10|nr:50S ribosomal protein L10 [bacterium]
MNREQKKQEIEDFGALYQGAPLLVVARNEGLGAHDVVSLRRSIRNSGGTLRVFKNTLAKKSLGENIDEKLEKLLVGPNSFLFGGENFVEDLKGLIEFAKDHEDSISIQGGTLDGEFLDPAKLKVISTLPGKDELRAQLLGTLQAPMRALVTALSGNITNLLNVLKRVEENKQNASE